MEVGSLRLARSPQAHECRSSVGAKTPNTSETQASSEARWLTIVGVAARTRYRELAAIRPTVYLPAAQFCDSAGRLAIRTSIRSESVASAIRGQLEPVEPGVRVVRVATLDTVVAATSPSRVFKPRCRARSPSRRWLAVVGLRAPRRCVQCCAVLVPLQRQVLLALLVGSPGKGAVDSGGSKVRSRGGGRAQPCLLCLRHCVSTRESCRESESLTCDPSLWISQAKSTISSLELAQRACNCSRVFSDTAIAANRRSAKRRNRLHLWVGQAARMEIQRTSALRVSASSPT